MNSIFVPESPSLTPQLANKTHRRSASITVNHQLPSLLLRRPCRRLDIALRSFQFSDGVLGFSGSSTPVANGTFTANSVKSRSGIYTVGDFMTRKEDLHAVKPKTTVDEALEILVEKRITGFPVVDDDWKLVGLVSDYDLLALDSISGGRSDNSMFPEVDSTWKTFNEVQKLLSKTNGKLVGDLMTPAPIVVGETTNLEDAARLLLETKYRRLPVVDADGKLVGIITRGNVVRAALHIKRTNETQSKET